MTILVTAGKYSAHGFHIRILDFVKYNYGSTKINTPQRDVRGFYQKPKINHLDCYVWCNAKC